MAQIANRQQGLEVHAYARLHITLVNLGDDDLRRYGGAGFSIGVPAVIVSAVPSSKAQVRIYGACDRGAVADIDALLCRLRQLNLYRPLTLRIRICLPQHSGFGTKTALLMAIALAASWRRSTSPTRRELQALSTRGGTSGIGVHAFFTGGYIVDGGHPRLPGEPYLPSSANRPTRVPPLVSRAPVSPQWEIHLILPPRPHTWSGKREVSFFQRNTPIPRSEVARIATLVQHELTPAMIEADLEAAQSAISRISATGFKHREILAQTRDLRLLLADLQHVPRALAGMSSIGPLLYTASLTSDELTRTTIRDVVARAGFRIFAVTRPRNRGSALHLPTRDRVEELRHRSDRAHA